MELSMLKQQMSTRTHDPQEERTGSQHSIAKPSSSKRYATKESAVKSSSTKQPEAVEESDCALCGRRAFCAPGTCFCSQCSARMDLLGPSSPEVGISNNRTSPPSRSSSADSIKSWSPSLGVQPRAGLPEG